MSIEQPNVEELIFMTQDFDAAIAGIAVDAAREILNCTPQLYRISGLTPPVENEPWATGVLLKVNDSRFLITAAHVIEQNGRPIDPQKVGIMIGSDFHILNGHIKYSALGQHPNNQRIDLVLWRIDDASILADLEARYRFLESTQLDIDHSPGEYSNYLVVGFPISKSEKKRHSKRIRVKPFIFLTKQPVPDLYGMDGFERHSHLIVAYRKKKIKNSKGKMTIGPDLEGISGCGLWHIPELRRDDKGHVSSRLVGIIHQLSPKHHVIIATRIHIVTEALRHAFGVDLPKSTITKVNLLENTGYQSGKD